MATHELSEVLEVLLARVGRKLFALPLGTIEHILPVDGNESARADLSGVLSFQGEPVAWHPLWPLLEETSCFATLDEIGTLLPQRRQDHIDWVGALEQSLNTGAPFTKARTHRDCAFGQWYYAYHTDDRQLCLTLEQFEAPHARIHALADKLLGLAEAGQRVEALAQLAAERETTLARLLQLFDRLVALLPTLKRQQAIIVTDQECRHALGIDGVVDIHAVSPDQFRPTMGEFGGLHPAGFVLGIDNGQPVPLLDAGILIGL